MASLGGAPHRFSRGVCSFHRRGACVHGARCNFSHDLRNGPLCRFHVDGCCRYGATCMYIHGETCRTCNRPVLHPYNEVQRKAHVDSCRGEESKAIECSICFDVVREFGLLPACDHAFCIECISKWRKSKDVERSVSASCPVCRRSADFVLRSMRYLAGHEKDLAVVGLLEARSKRRCKYYEKHGDCPKGAECHFAHLNRDGSPAVLPPAHRSRFRSRRLGGRWQAIGLGGGGGGGGDDDDGENFFDMIDDLMTAGALPGNEFLLDLVADFLPGPPWVEDDYEYYFDDEDEDDEFEDAFAMTSLTDVN